MVETGVPEEKHRSGFERTTLVVIGTDCKSNYHMITTTTALILPIEILGTFILNYYELCVFRIEDILKQIYLILLN